MFTCRLNKWCTPTSYNKWCTPPEASLHRGYCRTLRGCCDAMKISSFSKASSHSPWAQHLKQARRPRRLVCQSSQSECEDFLGVAGDAQVRDPVLARVAPVANKALVAHSLTSTRLVAHSLAAPNRTQTSALNS